MMCVGLGAFGRLAPQQDVSATAGHIEVHTWVT
jgi:hypothetical protein